jgi:hypothetical protein
MAEISNTIEWNSRLEKYFADTGEKAHGLSWLHKKAQERYSALKNYSDLPVIILGVLNGSVSIGSSSLFGDSPFASVCVGIIALITAILSTIASYFKWAARSEAHRIAALQYSKLYRFLSVQCSLPRHERMTPADLLKYTKDSYDRMAEVAPLIPPEVVKAFKRKFDKPEYKDLSKPEETNGLEHIEIYGTTVPMSPSRTVPDLLSYAKAKANEDKPTNRVGSTRTAPRLSIVGSDVGEINRPTVGSITESLSKGTGGSKVQLEEHTAEE